MPNAVLPDAVGPVRIMQSLANSGFEADIESLVS